MGYLKLDYNVNIGAGTENGDESAGAGLLGHHRAHLDWLGSLLARYPGLVLENCSSGGLRMDYAQLAVVQVQSTSDQQDPSRYPPIAAAAPTAVTPEQAAVWAYPQPDFSLDRIAFTLTGALSSRIHLSGFLDRMDPEQFALVRSGVAAYKALRSEIPDSLPFWPLGLPSWEDSWIASGLRGDTATWLTLWRRQPTDEREGGPRAQDRNAAADSTRTVTISHLRGAHLHPTLLYPSTSDATATWDAAAGELSVSLPRPDTAVLLRLDAVPPTAG